MTARLSVEDSPRQTQRFTNAGYGLRILRADLTKKPVKVNSEEAKLASLTQKEWHVIRADSVGSGAPNKTLASRLFDRAHLPKSPHFDLPEAGVASRIELYVYAMKHRLDVLPH